ncbi:hypothetical protein UY3_18537 [Chelonia mydas]|uniref:Uncharacterized protein n=1 Tax=Chelonia mydas TaxID=8469 RepID=M7B7T0_CHEMY|nr:hypothetical protein UY3_18537 [Chelonia mydas]
MRSMHRRSIYWVYSTPAKSTADRSPVDSCTPPEQEAQGESMGERFQLTSRSVNPATVVYENMDSAVQCTEKLENKGQQQTLAAEKQKKIALRQQDTSMV